MTIQSDSSWSKHQTAPVLLKMQIISWLVTLIILSISETLKVQKNRPLPNRNGGEEGWGGGENLVKTSSKHSSNWIIWPYIIAYILDFQEGMKQQHTHTHQTPYKILWLVH